MEQYNLNISAEKYIERAHIFLQDEEWAKADEFFEHALDIEPKNSEAYLGKLLVELKLKSKEDIEFYPKSFLKSLNFKWYERFIGTNYKVEAIDILYRQALNIMNTAKSKNQLKQAIEIFEYLDDFSDSRYYLEICRKNLRKNKIHSNSKAKQPFFKTMMKGVGKSIILAVAVFVITVLGTTQITYKYKWRNIKSIVFGDWDIIGLNEDGTVVAGDSNGDGNTDFESLSDIKNISCIFDTTAGLKEDGSVVVINDSHFGRCKVEDWKDIKSIACGYYHTVGLKKDGTVIATGDNVYGQCNVGDWKDIKSIACGNQSTVGIKEDGTIVATGSRWVKRREDFKKWENIKSVACSYDHMVALKEDGTVVATGNNEAGQCNVGGWKDIESIACSDYITIGLKKDGTVVATGNNYKEQCNVGNWKNIKSIACSHSITAGVKEDGTVVFTGDIIKIFLAIYSDKTYYATGIYGVFTLIFSLYMVFGKKRKKVFLPIIIGGFTFNFLIFLVMNMFIL